MKDWRGPCSLPSTNKKSKKEGRNEMTINLTLSITDQELNDPAAMARLYKALDTLKGTKNTVIAEEELLDEHGELVPAEEPKAPAERKKKSAEPKEPTVTETEVRAALGKLQRTDGGKAKATIMPDGAPPAFFLCVKVK